ENLAYTPSGATASVQTDTNSSGGKWVELAGNSVGDSITFTTGSISAGTYQLQMEWKGLTSRGILQLSVDGSNLGSTLDQYATGQTYPTTTFGNVTFASTGTHTVKLAVTGKNASSSGYILSADKFTFLAQSGGGGGTVSAPSFSPASGTYGSAQNVTLTTSTSGASIRYTTDGSTPSETAGTLYSSAVNISATATLKAIAFKSGMTDSAVTSATYTISTGGGGNYTPAQIIAAVQSHMTSSVQVNTKPHINTMTRALNVNVYQVTTGVYAYTSSMAIDDDGSDPDPDPDHQNQTTWQDDNGAQLGAHHVPYYVLGDDCWDNEKKQGGNFHPCPHFYYPEHNITGLQFALIFYNGKVTGAVFGDTQGTDNTSTSSNDSRELGEASVKSAMNLGIPSSGTTGGVDNGVTVVIFSGSQWVVHGTNSTLNANAQAMVQKALNQLGSTWGL
ncbi:MAG TPA: chitobiase/beta-hexosaminidase C-terminal domain-containing protein, partial [Opitutaceae bacterium]|nr:chitobiase/beta-hexosaminidase C-terminal domain-containing protein [Opitutaceae bacterium]